MKRTDGLVFGSSCCFCLFNKCVADIYDMNNFSSTYCILYIYISVHSYLFSFVHLISYLCYFVILFLNLLVLCMLEYEALFVAFSRVTCYSLVVPVFCDVEPLLLARSGCGMP